MVLLEQPEWARTVFFSAGKIAIKKKKKGKKKKKTLALRENTKRKQEARPGLYSQRSEPSRHGWLRTYQDGLVILCWQLPISAASHDVRHGLVGGSAPRAPSGTQAQESFILTCVPIITLVAGRAYGDCTPVLNTSASKIWCFLSHRMGRQRSRGQAQLQRGERCAGARWAGRRGAGKGTAFLMTTLAPRAPGCSSCPQELRCQQPAHPFPLSPSSRGHGEKQAGFSDHSCRSSQLLTRMVNITHDLGPGAGLLYLLNLWAKWSCRPTGDQKQDRWSGGTPYGWAETILEKSHHSGGGAVGLLDAWVCPSFTGRTAEGNRVEERAGGGERNGRGKRERVGNGWDGKYKHPSCLDSLASQMHVPLGGSGSSLAGLLR